MDDQKTQKAVLNENVVKFSIGMLYYIFLNIFMLI